MTGIHTHSHAHTLHRRRHQDEDQSRNHPQNDIQRNINIIIIMACVGRKVRAKSSENSRNKQQKKPESCACSHQYLRKCLSMFLNFIRCSALQIFAWKRHTKTDRCIQRSRQNEKNMLKIRSLRKSGCCGFVFFVRSFVRRMLCVMISATTAAWRQQNFRHARYMHLTLLVAWTEKVEDMANSHDWHLKSLDF